MTFDSPGITLYPVPWQGLCPPYRTLDQGQGMRDCCSITYHLLGHVLRLSAWPWCPSPVIPAHIGPTSRCLTRSHCGYRHPLDQLLLLQWFSCEICTGESSIERLQAVWSPPRQFRCLQTAQLSNAHVDRKWRLTPQSTAMVSGEGKVGPFQSAHDLCAGTRFRSRRGECCWNTFATRHNIWEPLAQVDDSQTWLLGATQRCRRVVDTDAVGLSWPYHIESLFHPQRSRSCY